MEKDLAYKIKDWLTVLCAIISICTVVYMAGVFTARVDNLGKNFDQHVQDNKETIGKINDSISQIQQDIAKIKTKLNIN